GATVSDVCLVIEAFRRSDRSFITPATGPLADDSLVDIGHESLLRQWKQLAGWVEEEAESAAMYVRLRDTARLWQTNEAALWADPDLGRALQWRQRMNPTEAWASRYGLSGDFALAMRFLEASEREHLARKAAARQARERALHRARRLALIFGTVAAALTAGIVRNRYLYVWEHET